jgi:hypothetical protein
MGAIETGLVLVISFIILMAMGVPISVATGGCHFYGSSKNGNRN